MRINYGSLTFKEGAFGIPVFEMRLGAKLKVLTVQTGLDSECREADSALIARTLRELADELDKVA